MLRFLALALIALMLVSCSDDVAEQTWRLEKFVSFNRIGKGKDVWLVKHNAFGTYEKVALIFGFGDDHGVCENIVTVYRRQFPGERYLCDFAN